MPLGLGFDSRVNIDTYGWGSVVNERYEKKSQ